ncbi:MAG: CNNM domain-containing protein, partial [Bacteroidales bacterium]
MESIDPFQEIMIIQNTVSAASLIIEIAVLLILLLCSAMISGAEVAFFSLGRDDIRELSKKRTPRSAAVTRLFGKPEELISTIIIVNTFVNISVVLLSAYICEQLFVFSGNRTVTLLIEIILITSVLILFGELIPRVYAAKANIRFSRMMALPLVLCMKLFRPLITVLIRSGSLIKRRAGH